MSIPVTVALVDKTRRKIPADELTAVAVALTDQWHSDLLAGHPSAPRGSVQSFGRGPAPARTWQIQLLDVLDDPGALGYHTDDGNQPFAVVDATDAGDWHVTASHELLEMLVDPWGNKMHGARLPDEAESAFRRFGLPHASSHVHYLLEVSDPCEATVVRARRRAGERLPADSVVPNVWERGVGVFVHGWVHGAAAGRAGRLCVVRGRADGALVADLRGLDAGALSATRSRPVRQVTVRVAARVHGSPCAPGASRRCELGAVV
jgi:hypothetical protein